MISKIIHYCWFGNGQKTKFILDCIQTWKDKLPDYEIIEWNETNCDIENSCEFVKKAYAQKKWAYVSDFFRLKALVEYGGVYIDTDVEIIKPFDGLLNNDFFCCFESEGFLCTAVLGCKKGEEIIGEFLKSYYNREFAEVPNSKLLFDFLVKDRAYSLKDSFLIDDKKVIYPYYYFSPKDFYTKKVTIDKDTYAVHHFDGTWKSKGKKFKDSMQNVLIKLLGKEKYFSIKKNLKRNSED